MNSDQLVKFKALCEHNSLTEAANSIYITQSAMSQSLKKLEDELGCKLFTRQQGRLEINQNGQKLLKYANKILSDLKRAEDNMKTPYKITIASTNICAAFMLQTLTTNQLQYITLTEIEDKNMPHALKSGEIDIATCDDYYMYSSDIPKLKKTMVCIEQLALLVPEDHELYNKKFLTFDDIDGLPLCTRIDIPSQINWIKRIQLKRSDINFNIQFMMERYTFGYIRDKIPYPEILSTNSVINLAPPAFDKNYKYIRIVEPEAKRNLYMWYTEDNVSKADFLSKAISEYYKKKIIRDMPPGVKQEL